MTNLLLSSIAYGGYISAVKLALFLILFFLWLKSVSWVDRDARETGTKEEFWTIVVFAAGATMSILWLIVPFFIVGLLLYTAAVGSAVFLYAKKRDSAVEASQRVLTAARIKELTRTLFTKGQKSKKTQKKTAAAAKSAAATVSVSTDPVFITANNNEVPVPEQDSADFNGYKATLEALADSTWKRAEIILFSPGTQNYNVTYYIDGVSSKQPPISRERMECFSRFVKNLANMDPNEKRKPQRGKFRTHTAEESCEWRVTSAGSTVGEQVQLKRAVRQDVMRLEDIGLTADQNAHLNALRESKHGLFIVSGPKKSGVTTTLYALLKNHDPFLYTVSTLEKQPSAEIANITQNIFALSDTGITTYAKKLQSIIRTGSDIIGVAECTDAETAKVACAAAKEGKIIYIAIEADSAVKALGKWFELVGDKNTATEVVSGISNQRLMRKLCEKCKQAYEPNAELLRKFNIPADKAKVLYRHGEAQNDKKGKPILCPNCQGAGFIGRMCVFEVMTLNEELKTAVKQAPSPSDISTLFRRAKMLSLQDQALKKVLDGTTAINEIIRVFAQKQETKKTQ